ncbi:MAG TPA: glucosyl-3-phosphoglycerate synthase [Solirubrobacteraceae bacterium]|nr:glucosyl-3-phosphoglycerate synthase [Solirubrobacteraceae bacterium]
MPARAFHHSAFTAERVAQERAERGLGVSVCLPARQCAGTVGEIVVALQRLRVLGAIDRIVVVDAGSSDGTAEVAEQAGAEVWQEDELLPSFGAVQGKGDAMWRALSRLDSELVCFVDADSEGFSAHFVTGLLGPLVCEQGVSFVKAFYKRPLGDSDEGGGRVNHLAARPALALLYPELAEIRQPLAGEVAARRELLALLPFATGYGVETAMLIDAWREVGIDGIAQVDLDRHINHHQPLSALAPMALTVLATTLARAQRDERATFGAPIDLLSHAPLERPPLAGLTQPIIAAREGSGA